MAEEKDMTKIYVELKAKYDLPALNELDQEFCVGKLEETDFVLRSVINKMGDRLEHVSRILGDIIQPENSLSHLYESEAFSDDERKNIFELYKKVSYYHTKLLINDFEHDEESAAKLINTTFKKWTDIKKEFLKILDKVREAWKNEKKSKLELGYFG